MFPRKDRSPPLSITTRVDMEHTSLLQPKRFIRRPILESSPNHSKTLISWKKRFLMRFLSIQFLVPAPSQFVKPLFLPFSNYKTFCIGNLQGRSYQAICMHYIGHAGWEAILKVSTMPANITHGPSSQHNCECRLPWTYHHMSEWRCKCVRVANTLA